MTQLVRSILLISVAAGSFAGGCTAQEACVFDANGTTACIGLLGQDECDEFDGSIETGVCSGDIACVWNGEDVWIESGECPEDSDDDTDSSQ